MIPALGACGPGSNPGSPTFNSEKDCFLYCLKHNYFSGFFMAQTVTIAKTEYAYLKKKADFADDVLCQLESSLGDIEAGRIKQASH